MPGEAEETILMMVDPETKEAFRRGEGPKESGPLFFTSRERLDDYARREGIPAYSVVEVPAGVVGRMKGKPHWIDGRKG